MTNLGKLGASGQQKLQSGEPEAREPSRGIMEGFQAGLDQEGQRHQLDQEFVRRVESGSRAGGEVPKQSARLLGRIGAAGVNQRFEPGEAVHVDSLRPTKAIDGPGGEGIHIC